jgi:hypothetical protein
MPAWVLPRFPVCYLDRVYGPDEPVEVSDDAASGWKAWAREHPSCLLRRRPAPNRGEGAHVGADIAAGAAVAGADEAAVQAAAGQPACYTPGGVPCYTPDGNPADGANDFEVAPNCPPVGDDCASTGASAEFVAQRWAQRSFPGNRETGKPEANPPVSQRKGVDTRSGALASAVRS